MYSFAASEDADAARATHHVADLARLRPCLAIVVAVEIVLAALGFGPVFADGGVGIGPFEDVVEDVETSCLAVVNGGVGADGFVAVGYD